MHLLSNMVIFGSFAFDCLAGSDSAYILPLSGFCSDESLRQDQVFQDIQIYMTETSE